MLSKRYNLIAAFMLLALGLQAQTITLDQCRQMAINGSARAKNADLDRLSARELQKESFWAYLPSASITGGTFFAFNPMLEITLKDVLGNSDMANNLIYSLEASAHSYGIDPIFRSLSRGNVAMMTVSQPLFTGGRILNYNRLAKIGYESASLRQSLTQREICDEVEAAFWQTVSLNQKRETLDKAITMVESICNTLNATVNAGLSTKTDLMQAKQQLSQLKSDLTRLDNGILLSKMNLCNLIGQDYAVLKELASANKPYLTEINFPGTMEGLLSPETYYRDEAEICALMEETQLLALSEKAALLQKHIATGETMPQVSIGASYGYNDMLNHHIFNGIVYAMVKIPLTDWGKNSHAIRRRGYDVQKAANDSEYLSEQILLGVRKLWMDASAAWQQIESDEQIVSISQARLQAVEADYNAGMATINDLLQAQTAMLQSNNALTDSKIAYMTAIRKYINLPKKN